MNTDQSEALPDRKHRKRRRIEEEEEEEEKDGYQEDVACTTANDTVVTIALVRAVASCTALCAWLARLEAAEPPLAGAAPPLRRALHGCRRGRYALDDVRMLLGFVRSVSGDVGARMRALATAVCGGDPAAALCLRDAPDAAAGVLRAVVAVDIGGWPVVYSVPTAPTAWWCRWRAECNEVHRLSRGAAPELQAGDRAQVYAYEPAGSLWAELDEWVRSRYPLRAEYQCRVCHAYTGYGVCRRGDLLVGCAAKLVTGFCEATGASRRDVLDEVLEPGAERGRRLRY